MVTTPNRYNVGAAQPDFAMAHAPVSVLGLRETHLLKSEESPIRALRKRLTLTFIWISVLIYLFASALAMIVSASSLNGSIDANIRRLIAEIQPAVKVENGELTLHEWAANAQKQNLHILHVVQLFDRNRNLREQYGVPGVTRLIEGRTKQIGLRYIHNFRSSFVPVQNAGYLQIQVDTKQTDEAFQNFLVTMLLLVPVVAVVAGGAGYLFCGKAVAPVSQSFRVLRRFVDDAGHELRTPVAIISASLETLDQSLSDHKENLEVIDKVSRASRRLKTLSSDLVTLASMESPELELTRSPIDVAVLVGNVGEDFEHAAQEKNITLICEPGSAATLMGNSDALQRMLSNVLDNAIRYTPSGGTVKITGAVHNSNVDIVVEDTGIGIPAESLKHVFDRFYRVDKARTREQGGTGLGLSIARAIAEAHGGTITVESHPGEGSKFTVMLPARLELRGHETLEQAQTS